jgi:penicillin-binding protein 1A
VEKAAVKFFGKSARDVSLSEAAILAGVLKAPSYYNPVAHPERAKQRAELVIADMVEEGFITSSEAERAASVRTEIKAADYVPATQYVVDWVADQLPELIGELTQSIIVETTMDRELQELAEKAVRARLAEEGAKLDISQAAMVVLDTEGAVKAMVGGKSYIKSQFNRAVKAKRQPGSSFKPFVYLAALEQGATPDSVEVDEPVTIGDWSPENYKRKYLGPVTLRKALALSLNTVAARLAAATGPSNVVSTAHRLGIVSPLEPNASIALGTSEVTLLELTAAFAPFANGGNRIVPHVVTRITTRSGQVLYERRGDGLGQVMMPYDVAAMNDMLRAVVTGGTGRGAAIPGHDIAGKTGTSQEYRDAWFIGYSAHLVAGVWVGNDDNTPTKRVTGGNLPAIVWKDVMEPAHRNLAPLPLPGDLGPSGDGVPVAGVRDPGFMHVLQGMFGRAAAVEPPTQTGGAIPGRAPTTREQQRNRDRLKDLLDSRR